MHSKRFSLRLNHWAFRRDPNNGIWQLAIPIIGVARRCFRLRIGRFFDGRYRPPGSHQPADDSGSLETSSRSGFAIRQSLPRGPLSPQLILPRIGIEFTV